MRTQLLIGDVPVTPAWFLHFKTCPIALRFAWNIRTVIGKIRVANSLETRDLHGLYYYLPRRSKISPIVLYPTLSCVLLNWGETFRSYSYSNITYYSETAALVTAPRKK